MKEIVKDLKDAARRVKQQEAYQFNKHIKKLKDQGLPTRIADILGKAMAEYERDEHLKWRSDNFLDVMVDVQGAATFTIPQLFTRANDNISALAYCTDESNEVFQKILNKKHSLIKHMTDNPGSSGAMTQLSKLQGGAEEAWQKVNWGPTPQDTVYMTHWFLLWPYGRSL